LPDSAVSCLGARNGGAARAGGADCCTAISLALGNLTLLILSHLDRPPLHGSAPHQTGRL
jgi:hypothetical protein